MRVSDNSDSKFAPISKTMPTRTPEPTSNRPVIDSLGPQGGSSPKREESSIEYVRKREPRVPLPILFLGFVAIAAAIIAFLYFSRP
jgi:hypothetical protein